MLRGTERAQAQVPAACLGVGDPQAAEAGRGIDGEQEACQGLCGPGELWVSRAGAAPSPQQSWDRDRGPCARLQGQMPPRSLPSPTQSLARHTAACDPHSHGRVNMHSPAYLFHR